MTIPGRGAGIREKESIMKTPEDESEHLPPEDEEEEEELPPPVGPPKPSGIEETEGP